MRIALWKNDVRSTEPDKLLLGAGDGHLLPSPCIVLSKAAPSSRDDASQRVLRHVVVRHPVMMDETTGSRTRVPVQLRQVCVSLPCLPPRPPSDLTDGKAGAESLAVAIDLPLDRVPVLRNRRRRSNWPPRPAYWWICRSHCSRRTCQTGRQHAPRARPWQSHTTRLFIPASAEHARGERAVRSSRVSLATVCPFLVALHRQSRAAMIDVDGLSTPHPGRRGETNL